MRNNLEIASQVLVLIFVLSTLFSVGLLVSTRQVLAGVQQRRSLGMALCANFVVLPGAALALCWALQLTPSIQAAVLLVATAPGSPALLRLNEFARGDQAAVSSDTRARGCQVQTAIQRPSDSLLADRRVSCERGIIEHEDYICSYPESERTPAAGRRHFAPRSLSA